MAKKKVPEGKPAADSTALNADEGVVIPRMSLKEQGFISLQTTNGYIIQEPNRAFRYPAMIKVVDEMRLCPSVATALNAYRLLMNRVEWDVEPPVGATPQQVERAKFIKSCMDDMTESWKATTANWFDYLEYGSHVSEKVFRRRLRKNGSKFDDGLVGLKKIAPRSRASLQRWDFSPDGRELLGVEQTLRYMDKSYLYMDQLDGQGLLYIPREKFLLFTCDGYLGNPDGNSFLKAIYLAYKQLTLLQDQLLLGIAKDAQGILKIEVPPRYLDANASDSDKAVLAGFQAIIQNYNAGTQRGLLVPAIADPESKLPMFTYELMEMKGTAKYDVEAAIKRLEGNILDAMSCGILKMGMDTAGSFSAQDGDTNILTLAVGHRLQEVAEVLNHDLIPQLFALNGWSDTDLPKFVHRDISGVSMEEFSKLVQRTASVGLLPVNRSVVNRILEVGGFEVEPDDAPIKPEEMAGFQSNAGKGMSSPTGEGTRTNSFGGNDSSTGNNENAA
jgi:hypothetical protein